MRFRVAALRGQIVTTARRRFGAIFSGVFLLVLSSVLTTSTAHAVQAFSNADVAGAGLAELGTSRPTGWNQPGECVKSVQRWVAAAGGYFGGGGVISGYDNSGAQEVSLGSAVKGDVIQYTNANGNDQDWSHAHTMVVITNHGNGRFDIVQSNSPAGSGLVTRADNMIPTPAAGWVSRVWRFGTVHSGPVPNRIALLTPDSQIFAKDDLAAGNWLDQNTAAPSIDVGGRRSALINPAGRVYAKDHLGAGGWLDQGAAADKVVVGFGGRMYLITPDGWVYGKDDITSVGGWLNQGAQAVDVAIGLDRVAIITPCGAIYAKNTLHNGGWIQQSDCYTATDVEVSSTGRVAFIRTDGAVFAKDDITGRGGWLNQNASATQLKLGANRLLILTPDSHVYAKDHLGAGGWIDQGATAVQIAISDQGRLILRNPFNQVYAKDTIGPAGWLDQAATAIAIAS
ncbi:hypothetical protein SAMN04489731_106124 [Amycolatopsis regifaucium]|nr:hypothetical protein SAMN04489731_106124 [Amycolatopsis regifaucium]